jgi:hypothetical protein
MGKTLADYWVNRHWVREGPLPDMQVRPMVGRADDAAMEMVWDAWRLAYLEDKRLESQAQVGYGGYRPREDEDVPE